MLHAARSLEAKWFGDDSDSESVQFLGERGHYGRSSSSGAAAETGGDEHHVGAFQHFDDALGVFERGLPAEARIGTGAKTAGDFSADCQFIGNRRCFEGLHVGIENVEFDTGEPLVHHASYGVRASAADADHLDPGAVQSFFFLDDKLCRVHFKPPCVWLVTVLKIGDTIGVCVAAPYRTLAHGVPDFRLPLI